MRLAVQDQKIRSVDDVSRSAELIGEGETPGGQTLCMMEERKLGHVVGSFTRRLSASA